jgi:hypothetical protein
MSRPPAKPRISLSAEDRADLALLRKQIREMEESGEALIPWEEAERRLAALRAEEDADRERKRQAAFGPKSARVDAEKVPRRAAARKSQR